MIRCFIRALSIAPQTCDEECFEALCFKGYCNRAQEFYLFDRYDINKGETIAVNDGSPCFDTCIIRGPFQSECGEIDRTRKVSTDGVLFSLGTPVICRGLENPDTRGKIGDIRLWDKDTKQYTIYFEDDDLEPCLVKTNDILVLHCYCDRWVKPVNSNGEITIAHSFNCCCMLL